MTDARFGKAMPDPIIGGIGGAVAGWLITLLAFLVSRVPDGMLAKTRTYPGANGRTQEKQNRLKAGFIVTSRMIQKSLGSGGYLDGARSRTRTGTLLLARDFKSPASTDFAIRAVALR